MKALLSVAKLALAPKRRGKAFHNLRFRHAVG